MADSLAKSDKAAIKTPHDYIVKHKEQQLAANKNKYFRIISLSIILLLMVTGGVFFYRHRFKREVRLSTEKIDEMTKKIEQHDGSRSEELKEIIHMAVNNDSAFIAKYDKFDPDFSKKLLSIAPNLSTIEIKFCLLLKLNFETKEIAQYTNASVRTVEGKKYRTRKKLDIPSNQDINIWINSI